MKLYQLGFMILTLIDFKRMDNTVISVVFCPSMSLGPSYLLKICALGRCYYVSVNWYMKYTHPVPQYGASV